MKSVLPKYSAYRPKSIDFSADGRRIILGGKLWSAKTGALMNRVFDEEELISTDNIRIVLASDDTTEIKFATHMTVNRTAVLETRTRSMVAAEHRAAQDRSELLRPLVENWFAESRDEQKTLLDDEVLRRLEQETTTRTPDEAATLRNLTLKRFREGLFTDEIAHLEFMLEAHRQEFGPRDRKTLKTAAQIAWEYKKDGETDRAIQLLTEALPMQREALGDQDELTLWSLMILGDLYIKQENHEAAIPFLLESLPGLVQVQGPEHRRTKYLKSLLRPALRQNPFDDFLPTADPILTFNYDLQPAWNNEAAAWEPIRKMISKEELLSAQRLTYGNQNRQTLYTMNKLGQSLLQGGEFETAAALLLESMTSRQSTLGPKHKATLFAIEKFAQLHEAWHEAEPSQGHDIQAADYRSLHEHRSAVESEDSDTDEPAQIGGTRDDA